MNPKRSARSTAIPTIDPIAAAVSAGAHWTADTGARFQDLGPMPTWSHAVQLAPGPPTVE